MSYTNLWRAVRRIEGYKRFAIFAVLALLIGITAQLAVPIVVQFMLNTMTVGLGKEATAALEQALVNSMAIIFVLATICAVFLFLDAYLGERLSQDVAYDLRNDLVAKIESLSFSYHDRNSAGQLMIRATDDVEKVRQFLGQGLLMIVQALVLLVGAFTMMFLTSWQLTLVVLPVLPIALILFRSFGSITQPMFMRIQITLSILNAILQENIAGAKVVKAFVREEEEYSQFDKTATTYMQQEIDVSKVFSFLFPLIFLVANLGQAALLYFGGRQIIEGSLSIGEWQKFSLYLVYLFFPMGQLGLIISQLNQASASATRIYQILDTQSAVRDKPDAKPLPPIQGRVAFQNVGFRYFDGGPLALSDFTFEAQPGQTVALLGATGSGKSTAVNLIPRFYDASEGQVLIDGVDVRDVQLLSLRSQVGVVFQDIRLADGTVRDNITFGLPTATDAQVQAAAAEAAADEFIAKFPQGYATPVTEGGNSMSGGQKQRIAIARALLINPRILIMDDATASLDATTEARVVATLQKLMHDRTCFVIAERISTVERADEILVLDRGQIAARGRHADLLANSPLYAEIYHSQLLADQPRTGPPSSPPPAPGTASPPASAGPNAPNAPSAPSASTDGSSEQRTVAL